MTTENETPETAQEDASAAVEIQTPASEPEEQKSTAPTHNDQAFFEYLAKQYSAGDIKQNFRTMKHGFFINETQADNVVEHYRHWLQETTNSESAKSVEKIKRKLFGEELPKLYYILDGKTCIAGYLVERTLEVALQKRVPYSQSVLLETSNYVHPRDPALATLEGVKSSFDQVKGFRFFADTPQGTVQFSTEFLSQFGTTIRNIPTLTKENEALRGPLRGSIPLLIEFLKKSRVAKENQRLLVPTQFQKHPSELFYLTEHVVFVLDQQKNITSCYGLNRKNIKKLISQELAREIKMHITNTKLIFAGDWKIGTIKINHKLYTLHQDILSEALLRADRSPRLRKACAGKYTIFAALKEIAEILKEANLVVKANDATNKDNSKKEAPKGKPHHEKKQPTTVSYLKFQNWTFTIAGKNVISSFEEKLKPKGDKKPQTKAAVAPTPSTPNV